MESSATPLVSVLTITYNQENYIRQAIESVLEQEIPFSYELVIGEHHSTDNTWQIVSASRDSHPEVIRAFRSERTVGLAQHFVRTLRACRGRYVALLAGDDYWLSPDKLRKQVEVLEPHPECAICCSRARVIYEDGSGREPWDYPVYERMTFTIAELLRENFIPECTAVFRLGLLLEIPPWFHDLPFGDWALFALLAQHGDIVVLPETLAAYRFHGRGLWTGQGPEEMALNRAKVQRQLAAYLPEEYSRLIREINGWTPANPDPEGNA